MRSYQAGFKAVSDNARSAGIQPVYFVWIVGKDRTSGAERAMGFWSRSEDITLTVPAPDGTGATRAYLGGCGLSVTNLKRVGNLMDHAVTVSMSQIAPAAQELARGLDPRLAYVEIHVTSMAGGSFASDPQLEWVGIVDEGPISTPGYGSDGGIAYSVRSELMAMLTATNPAKSSDAHQKRRQSGDEFSKYASTVGSRKIQWYQRG